MNTRQFLSRPLVAWMATACLVALPALADTSIESRPVGTAAYSPQPSGPSANNESFKRLRAQCEQEVPSGKASGDICVQAAAILISGDLPDEFREVKEDQRIKIALRLLERGVDSSNLARGRAYDYYNRIGFLGMSTYADPYRAKELMDMMVQSDYAGGTLRRIRSQTTLLSFGASEAEKREGCAQAKTILARGKLDTDSTNLAKEIVASGICTGYDQAPK